MATCNCSARHQPRLIVTNLHHILPKSWGGQTVPANMIELCPSMHETVHALLNEYVRANGTPPATVLKRYPPFARRLAQRTIEMNGGKVSHIWTIGHGAVDEDPRGDD